MTRVSCDKGVIRGTGWTQPVTRELHLADSPVIPMPATAHVTHISSESLTISCEDGARVPCHATTEDRSESG